MVGCKFAIMMRSPFVGTDERTRSSQANTMLMYPLGEAVLLLSEKLSTAKKNLTNIREDLEFLREQVTVMEVNFARVHNVSSSVLWCKSKRVDGADRALWRRRCSGMSSGKSSLLRHSSEGESRADRLLTLQTSTTKGGRTGKEGRARQVAQRSGLS